MGEFLNKLKSGATEFWGGLDKGQKTRIIIAGVLSILIIAGFVIYASNPQYGVLYSDLSKEDAGQIDAKLKELGVKSKMQGTTILVPKDRVDELRAQLAVEGLPTDDSTYPDVSKPSFYETTEDKKERYLIQKQNQLAIGIKAIKGVEWAKVNLYIPDDNSFILAADKTESTAAIIIKMRAGMAALDESQVNGIIQYVSKSVKGLKPENVSIINDMGKSLVPDKDELGTQVNTQMDMQDTIRKNIEKSISKFLETVFGPDNVDVRAGLKLNFNNEVENSTVYEAPDKEKNAGIVRNMQDIKKEWVDAGTGGVPGTDTNTSTDTTTTTTSYPTTDTESNAKYNEASTIVNYEINETKKQIVKEQGNIESLSISVIINEDSLKGEMSTNKEQLVNNIKELVKYAAQGFNTQPGALDNNINVSIMKFNTSVKDEVAKAQQEQQNQARNQNIIMIGTAIAAVLVFALSMFLFLRRRSTVQRAAQEEAEIYAAPAGPVVPIAEIDTEDKNQVKQKIEKFVGQKPEQVAQLLKTWLNEE